MVWGYVPKLIVRFGNDNHFKVNCSHEYKYPRQYIDWNTRQKKHYKIIKFIFSFKYIPVPNSIMQEGPRRKQILESNYIEEITHSIKMEPIDVCLKLKDSPSLEAKYKKEINEIIEKKLEDF